MRITFLWFPQCCCWCCLHFSGTLSRCVTRGRCDTICLSTIYVFDMSHAINPPSCGKKGGGHKNVCVSKTLRCVSQRKLARKQNIGIFTRKLAL